MSGRCHRVPTARMPVQHLSRMLHGPSYKHTRELHLMLSKMSALLPLDQTIAGCCLDLLPGHPLYTIRLFHFQREGSSSECLMPTKVSNSATLMCAPTVRAQFRIW